MSLSSLILWFRAKSESNRRIEHQQISYRRFEQLEDRNLLSATPLDPIEIPNSEDAPVIPIVSVSDASRLFSREISDYVPTLVDEGDYYWHFDEKVSLQRVQNEFVVVLRAGAESATVMASLTGTAGLLPGFQASVLSATSFLLRPSERLADQFPDVESITSAQSSIAWTVPVFMGTESGSRIFLFDEVSVALEPSVDPKDFFATGFSEWRRFFGNQYIATVSHGGGRTALELANALASDSRVEWAAPNFKSDFQVSAIPNDPLFDDQWHLHNTGQTGANADSDADLPMAWDVTTGSPGIVVAVLDNGVQLDHPDLNIWINQNEIPTSLRSQLVDVDDDGLFTFVDLNDSANVSYVTDFNSNSRIDANDLLSDSDWANSDDTDDNGYVDDLFGWDFAGAFGIDIPDNNPNPQTQYDNHGTAVAGVVGAIGDNAVGITGSAQNVRIMPIKIARDDNNDSGGFVDYELIAEAVYYAAGIVIDANGDPTAATWEAADILVNSWGGGSAHPMLSGAFNYIQTHGRNGLGVVSFNAAGNDADGTVPELKYQKIEIPVTGGPSVTKQYVWSYQLNGDAFIAGENRAWIADITLPNGTHELLDVDNNLTGWSSGSWTIEDDPTHSYGTARYVARSGQLTQPLQQSNLVSPVISVSANGSISFARYVSSQYTNSTTYDPLALFEITNGGTPNLIWLDAGNPLPVRPVAYPASIGSNIAVGASTDWDYRSAYSQFGPALDIVAPSSGGYGAVYTTDRTGTDGYNQQSGDPNQSGYDPLTDRDYTSHFTGTSAATPLAAGVAALILSKNPSLTADQVRQVMQGTADKIGGDNGLTEYVAGVNQFYGHGRVNAEAALNATPVLGDYNWDGVVNAADYVFWRDFIGSEQGYDWWVAGFGAGTPTLPGDYNSDGVVNAADYVIWRDNFGSTSNLDADGSGNGVVDLDDWAIWKSMFNVTLEASIEGDFDANGVVDMADGELWANGDPLADADGDMDVDQDDYDIWVANFGLTNAGVLPATLIGLGGPPARIASQAPHITEVTISGSASTHAPYGFSGVTGSGAQLVTVPVGGADTIEISFSEEVLVTSGSLAITRLQGGSALVVDEFTYDQASRSATWVFDSNLPVGQFLIQLSDSIFDLDGDALDGEFSNPWSKSDAAGTTSDLPSGDGEAGGEFRFRFTILPGDFNHDNYGNIADFPIWSNNNGMMSGATHGQGDGDGDGDVDSTDHGIWGGSFGAVFTNWQSSEPGMILVSTATDEDDANYTYGDVSLREALDIAASNAGHDTIVFRQDLWDSTLTLALGQLAIDSDVTIAGPGADRLAISANDASRVVKVNSGVTASLQDLTITEGAVSNANGAGIWSEGDLTLERVVVSYNVATRTSGTNGLGGGVYSSLGDLTIVDSQIEFNQGFRGSGVAKYRGGAGETFELVNSTIAYNDLSGAYGAHAFGGGIFLYAASPMSSSIVNSTISQNTALTGAGIMMMGDADNIVDIVNSTIAFNDAIGVGGHQGPGGIDNNGGTVTIHNTIVAANTSNSANYRNVSGVQSVSSYNVIGLQNTSPGFTGAGNQLNVSNTNVALDDLDYYGGPTKTHALLATSYGIDAANIELARDAADIPLTTDQRGVGFPRFLDDVLDVGAVEYESGGGMGAAMALNLGEGEAESSEPIRSSGSGASERRDFITEIGELHRRPATSRLAFADRSERMKTDSRRERLLDAAMERETRASVFELLYEDRIDDSDYADREFDATGEVSSFELAVDEVFASV